MDRKQIEYAIRNYHWMIREIERLRDVLGDAGEGTTHRMDEESGMPKAKGNTSNPVATEVIRRDKHWRRLKKLEDQVSFVQRHMDCITDDRERTVLDCLLDGMTLVAISLHMMTSEKQIRRLKDSIVDRIAENAENAENADFAEKADLLHR